jgi:hypothetical protein
MVHVLMEVVLVVLVVVEEQVMAMVSARNVVVNVK